MGFLVEAEVIVGNGKKWRIEEVMVIKVPPPIFFSFRLYNRREGEKEERGAARSWEQILAFVGKG